MEYISKSALQTQKIAATIARQFQHRGGIIALIGDMGAGKTAFAQGFAKGLGITDKIISPTFILIRQHPLPTGDRWLFHLDLYRLEEGVKISRLGLDEIFLNRQNIVLIEWAQKVLDQLPKNTLKIKLEKLGENSRKITLDLPRRRPGGRK